MKAFATLTAGAAFLAAPAFAATVEDGIAYVLDAAGESIIVSRDLRNPSNSTRVSIMGPSAGFNLEAIAYRPATGGFIGWDDETDTVYGVDVRTGAVTALASGADAPMSTNGGPVATTSPNVGVDFNNVLDAARIVSENGENLVFFPDDFSAPARQGTIDRFTDPFFVAGDVNAGELPQIVANAYTNAVANPSSTAQFVLLAGNEALGTLANNDGDVVTIGGISVDGVNLVDINQTAGFDILSLFDGDNLAFAQFVNAETNVSSLYVLELAAGANGFVNATELGSYGEVVRGLAVAPIPVPAAGLLLPAALGGLVLMRRRRRA